MAFHPEDRVVASCSEDRSIKLWNLDDGGLLSTMKVDDAVSSVAYSPDGSKLAAAHYMTVSIFNMETNEVLCTVKAHSDFVRAVAWSPCGQWLASGADDMMIYVYDTKTFEVKWPLICGDFTTS